MDFGDRVSGCRHRLKLCWNSSLNMTTRLAVALDVDLADLAQGLQGIQGRS